MNTVEATEDEIILLEQRLEGFEEELDAACREIQGLRLRKTLDAVMTDVEEDSDHYLTPVDLAAIREEIVRQID